eukprot:scpid104967/ scgid4607/ 
MCLESFILRMSAVDSPTKFHANVCFQRSPGMDTVDFIASKTATTIGQLWRHGRCLSLNARRAWYMSMIQSVLCYASNCFFPALSKLLLHRLLRIAKSGIRAIFQLPRRTPTALLFVILSMPQLNQLYVQCLLLYVFRCLHG